MSAVGQFEQRQERPAQIKFFREAVEDVAATQREGRYVARDVDFVRVFIPYSKDSNVDEVSNWLAKLENYVQQGRIPSDWLTQDKRRYEAGKAGQELPLDGTAIRGRGVISPAQQETLIHVRILTVEDLANINDDGARRIGMGAIEMKQKANTWLSQLNDRGPLTIKMAAIEAENALLKQNLAGLEKTIAQLLAQSGGDARVVVKTDDNIAADDILPEPEPPPSRKRKGADATI